MCSVCTFCPQVCILITWEIGRSAERPAETGLQDAKVQGGPGGLQVGGARGAPARHPAPPQGAHRGVQVPGNRELECTSAKQRREYKSQVDRQSTST